MEQPEYCPSGHRIRWVLDRLGRCTGCASAWEGHEHYVIGVSGPWVTQLLRECDARMRWTALIVEAAGGEVRVPDAAHLHDDWGLTSYRDDAQPATVWRFTRDATPAAPGAPDA